VRATLAIFELFVGLAFGFAVVVFLTSMVGIGELEVTIQGILFWFAFGLGPILLVVGPILVLTRPTSKLASALVFAGAAILTFWAVYFAIVSPAGRPDGGLDLRRLAIPASVFVVALTSDVAAYRIWQLGKHSTPGNGLK
jgi:hypothetical protein